jgi:PAS domain S-box-containing protein
MWGKENNSSIVTFNIILWFILLFIPGNISTPLFAYVPETDSLYISNSSSEEKIKQLDRAARYNMTRNYVNTIRFSSILLKEAEEQQNIYYEAKACQYLGLANLYQENVEMAKNYTERFFQLAQTSNNDSLICLAYSDLGLISLKKNEFDKGLALFYKSLAYAKKSNNIRERGSIYDNIGRLYFKKDKYLLSLYFFRKSIEADRKTGDWEGLSVSYYNIGDVYQLTKQFDLALRYYIMSEQLASHYKFNYMLELNYKSMAQLFESLKEYKKALDYHKLYQIHQHERFNELKQKGLNELEVQYQTDNKNKEIEELSSHNSRQKIILLLLLVIIFSFLVFSYLLYFQIRKVKRINRLLEEKNKQIERQNEEILTQSEQLEIKNQKLTDLSAVAAQTDNAVVIADALGTIEYINDGFTRMTGYTLEQLQTERKDNLFDVSFNPNIHEIIDHIFEVHGSANYETQTITPSGKELYVQTTLTPIFNKSGYLSRLIAIDTDISKLKTIERELSVKQQDLTSSIKYARRMQKELMPKTETLNKHLHHYFMLFKPKDIVSGDFYWLKEVDNQLYIAVADCTGHGVPGAFMSVLGITMLNDILGLQTVLKQNISPALILNELRKRIIDLLNQNSSEDHLQDGMDISLICIDKKSKKLHFAGAFSSMAVIRKEGNSYKELRLKGNRMPIGIHPKNEPFTNYEMQLMPGDRCYMYSDGYQQQPGGERHKKIMRKGLSTLLLQIQDFSIEKQKEELKRFYADWLEDAKKTGESFEQIDDITILGFELF